MVWKTFMITRNCPICQIALVPEEYEGFPLQRCPQCQGHLVELTRYQAIRSLPRKTLPELEAEAREAFSADTPGPLRCPRCHGWMRKQPLNVPGFDLHMDLCKGCALAWFDGGELALAQLGHQATPGFRDNQEFQLRAAALDTSPERKAAFEKAVAQLPLEKDPFSQGLKESVADALRYILFRSAFRFPFL